MKNIVFIFCLIFISKYSFSQDTIFVKEGDTNYMFRFAGFLDSLPDGHYTSYHAGDKTNIHIDIFYKNGQKEGVETRYLSMFPKQKYKTIQWKKGQKNGKEIKYLINGVLYYSLTYVENELNGRCIFNDVTGKRQMEGYFLNNYRDSIWNYYGHSNDSNMDDTADYWLFKQCIMKNGREILLNAWDRNGLQTVKNGKGFIDDKNTLVRALENFSEGFEHGVPVIKNEYGEGFIEQNDFGTRTIENFSEGLRNGKTTIYKLDNVLYKEQNYLNDCITGETEYYNNNSVAFQKEYTYLQPETVDTVSVLSFWGDHINHLYYNEVVFTNKPVRNGRWVKFYPNGNTVYEGTYNKGLRVGEWKWDYINGKPRIRANYDKNEFQHFDTTGALIASSPNEFLTQIVQSTWFLNQAITENEIILTSTPGYSNTQSFQFYYTGGLRINGMIYEHVFELIGDKLTLGLVDERTNRKTYYHFKIIKADESQIILKSIDKKGHFKK